MLLFVTPALMTMALVKGVGIGLVAGVMLSKSCRCPPKAADKPAP
jgi:hypothetical protein